MSKLDLSSKTLKFSISGMRGLFPEDLNAGNIPQIILAFHKTLKKGDIAIARDNRPTGIAIEEMVTGILASLGRNIHTLGLLPTPTIKAFVKEKNLSGAIMISASHNPIHYTAFKFIKEKGFFFGADENEKLKKNLDQKTELSDWGSYKIQGKKFDSHDEALEIHINSVINKVFQGKKPDHSKIKVALDTLGACATDIAPAFLNKLGIKYISLFPEVCYDFPRPPEPVEKSLLKLSRFVIDNKCDIGFAFDPDADRLAIVDHTGKPIGEELTLPVSIIESLFRKKGNTVINLSSSLYNEYAASLYGCQTFRAKVGEANVVELMVKKKAVIGGEGNGGVIDPDIPSYGRDSIAAMGWILSHMIRTKKSIVDIIAEFPDFKMKKLVIQGDIKTVGKIASNIKKVFPDWLLDNSDGFHFLSPDKNAWIHIRSSNTEPVIRVIAESSDKKILEKLLSFAKPD